MINMAYCSRLKKIIFLAVCLFAATGCSSLKYYAIKKAQVSIPQAAAYLQPSVIDNQLVISGKVVMQNLARSDFKFDRVFIEIKDETGASIDKLAFDWAGVADGPREEIEAPLDIRLPLTILGRRQIAFFLSTRVFYGKLGNFPSRVIGRDRSGGLKNTVIRPLDIVVYIRYLQIYQGMPRPILFFRILPSAYFCAREVHARVFQVETILPVALPRPFLLT